MKHKPGFNNQIEKRIRRLKGGETSKPIKTPRSVKIVEALNKAMEERRMFQGTPTKEDVTK